MEHLPERLRVRYTKTGRIRYTSQRDNARAWERALRRARLPIAYSEGFNPRPLLAFSLALPTGCESGAEYTDLRFAIPGEASVGPVVSPEATPADASAVGALLDSLLPEGLEVQAAAAIGDDRTSLQEQVTSCSWSVEVTGMTETELVERVEHLLHADSVPIERERKGRRVTDDLRPSIQSLSVEEGGSSPGVLRLGAELATKPRGVRPAELLRGISPTLRLVRACRRAQWIDHDGIRLEPLTTDGQLLGAAAPMAAESGR